MRPAARPDTTMGALRHRLPRVVAVNRSAAELAIAALQHRVDGIQLVDVDVGELGAAVGLDGGLSFFRETRLPSSCTSTVWRRPRSGYLPHPVAEETAHRLALPPLVPAVWAWLEALVVEVARRRSSNSGSLGVPQARAGQRCIFQPLQPVVVGLRAFGHIVAGDRPSRAGSEMLEAVPTTRAAPARGSCPHGSPPAPADPVTQPPFEAAFAERSERLLDYTEWWFVQPVPEGVVERNEGTGRPAPTGRRPGSRRCKGRRGSRRQ